MADSDWQQLAQLGWRPRHEALPRLLSADDPSAEAFCTKLIDVSLATSNLAKAFDEAVVAAIAKARVPDAPDQGTNQYVQPHVEFPMEAVFALLARGSHVRPRLALWLFEAMRFYFYPWWPKARAELDRANLEMALPAFIDSMVGRHELFHTLIKAFAERPAWLVPALEAIALDPTAAAKLADYARLQELHGARYPDDLRPRVVELAKTAPSGARAVAIEALRLFDSNDEIDSIVVAGLGESQPRIVEAAARLGTARANVEAAVLDAAMLAAERADTATLQTLIGVGRNRLAGDPSARPGIVEGPFQLWDPFVVGDLVVGAVLRVVRPALKVDQATDEHELAVVAVGRDFGAYHVAPLHLPSYRTIWDEQRGLTIGGVHDGRIVVAISVARADDRRTAEKNLFVLGCDPRDGSWVRYRVEGEFLVVDGPLVAPVEEFDLMHFYGPALLWSDEVGLHIVGDPVNADPYDRVLQVGDAMDAESRALGAARALWVETEGMHEELAAKWPKYDPASRRRLKLCSNPRVALVELAERQALIWL
ncbi:MAG TPA: hypothetical protein VL326_17835 [Kofleriaceae bacterium]|nr:hypothetical protein [Kofleriaceae bacterium]